MKNKLKKLALILIIVVLATVIAVMVITKDNFFKDLDTSLKIGALYTAMLMVCLMFMFFMSSFLSSRKYKNYVERQDDKRLRRKYPYKATVYLNAHFHEELRKDLENILNAIILKMKAGIVTGGKCIYKDTGEVEKCEVYLYLKYDSPKLIEYLTEIMNKYVKVPRGSVIEGPKNMTGVGVLGGLVCCLDVTGLEFDEETSKAYWETIDSISESLGTTGGLYSSWVSDTFDEEQKRTTVVHLYYYGTTYREMKEVIEPMISKSIFSDRYRFEQCS
ncbi:MAG: hypothetical protein K6B75_01235 [Lachnospiraceae bacterium]|nr:hypothetical protein [Lachnospiraceae bacterium]